MVSINCVVMQPASRRMIQALGPQNLEVAKVSGKWGAMFNFKSYEQFRYPEYEVCEGTFFVPYHAAPQDNSRWSARGLKNLLIEGGFEADAIHAEQCGNRHAALRNMEEEWPPEYDPDTDDIENDPKMPICSWALAQKV